MANMTDCNICCEKINSSTRKVVECNFCSFDLCRTCFQTYIADPAVTVPVCMNPVCKKELSDDFIQDNVSKVFYGKDYKNKMQQKILDTEMSFFPVTQTLLEFNIKEKKIAKQIQETTDRLKELKLQLFGVQGQSALLLADPNSRVAERNVVQFVKACPNTCCKGFLSNDWNCSLCETDVCETCHEIIDKDAEEEHECHPDTVQSVAMLKKDCKNCPKCASSIYKIDGCDQMFCTNCHTAFSWKTLRIEKGRLHNPHYYQWIRDNNNGAVPREREDEDEVAGRCNGHRAALPVIRLFQSNIDPALLKTDTMKTVWEIYMLVNHIEAVEVVRFPATRQVLLNTNMDIRSSYMMNEIDEAKYKSLLYKRDKDSRKKNEYNGIMMLFAQVIKERINFLYSRQTRGTVYINKSQLDTLITEAVTLKEYFNNTTLKISKKYGCIHVYINDFWQVASINIK